MQFKSTIEKTRKDICTYCKKCYVMHTCHLKALMFLRICLHKYAELKITLIINSYTFCALYLQANLLILFNYQFYTKSFSDLID